MRPACSPTTLPGLGPASESRPESVFDGRVFFNGVTKQEPGPGTSDWERIFIQAVFVSRRNRVCSILQGDLPDNQPPLGADQAGLSNTAISPAGATLGLGTSTQNRAQCSIHWLGPVLHVPFDTGYTVCGFCRWGMQDLPDDTSGPGPLQPRRWDHPVLGCFGRLSLPFCHSAILTPKPRTGPSRIIAMGPDVLGICADAMGGAQHHGSLPSLNPFAFCRLYYAAAHTSARALPDFLGM